MLIPSVVHDFTYDYDYIWGYRADSDGNTECKKLFKGPMLNDDGSVADKRLLWDDLFFDIGDSLNGVCVANYISYGVLHLFGSAAWEAGRNADLPELVPLTCVFPDPEATEHVN